MTARKDQSAENAARERIRATYSTQGFEYGERAFLVIKGAAELMASYNEIAAMLGISRPAFYDARQKYPEIDDVIDRGRDVFRMSLRGKQRRLAEKSAGMAIFLGKNYLEQRDVQDVRHGGDEANPVRHTMDYGKLSIEDLRELERLALKAAPDPIPANDTADRPVAGQEGDGRRKSG